MVDRTFQLKRSYLSMLFQLSILIILMIVLQYVLPLWLLLLCLIFTLGSYVVSLRIAQPLSFEHLDAQEWSLSMQGSASIQRLSISHMIDHQVYIVIYFQQKHKKPLLIWMDQVSFQQWKNLKKLVKLI